MQKHCIIQSESNATTKGGAAFGPDAAGSVGPGSVPAFTFLPDDDGAYVVTLTVTDADGAATASAGFAVTIGNAAPTIGTFTLPATGSEGTTISASAAASDPAAANDTLTYTWSVVAGNGQAVAGGTGTSFSFTPNDNGTYSVTLTVDDGEGGSATRTGTVLVANVAPSAVAALGSPTTLDEGGTFAIGGGSFADPGTRDTHTVLVNWGDGGSSSQNLAAGVLSFGAFPDHTYADDGAYTVLITVTDKDGASASTTLAVTVNNVAPVAMAPADQTANEGAPALFDLGSFADPGTDGPWEVSVDWGDGTPPADFTRSRPGALPQRSHTYADDGTYTVTVTVAEAGGSPTGSTTFMVAVADIIPTASVSGPSSGTEGTSVTFSGSLTDPAGTSDGSYSFIWTATNGTLTYTQSGAVTAPGAVPSFAFTPGDDGAYAVTLEVTDADGVVGTSGTVSLSVANADPTITGFNVPFAGTEGTAITLAAIATDPAGANDPLTYTWTITPPAAVGASFTLTGSSVTFTPADDGAYGVSLTVTDGDSGSATRTSTIAVANIAPTVAINGPFGGREGSALNFTSTATDPAGTSDPLTYNWTVYKDGVAFGTAGSAAAYSFTPDDNASYTLVLTVSDGDGGSTTATRILPVTNVVPTLAIGGNPPVNEGAVYTLMLGGVTDPGTDSVTSYTVHWGDGATDIYTTAGPKTHTFANGPATYAITVDVTDEDGTFSNRANALSVSVANVAPTATIASGPTTSNEGAAVSFAGTFTDPARAADAAFTYTWHVVASNGQVIADATGSVAVADYGSVLPFGFSPNDNGTYTVTLVVADRDGAPSPTATRTLTVANVAPTATLGNNGPRYAAGPVTVAFTRGSDPSSVDASSLRYSFDLNNDGDFTDAGEVANSPSRSIVFSASTAGEFVVHGRIGDKDGGFTDSTTVVRVLPIHYSAASAGPVVIVSREDGSKFFEFNPFAGYAGTVSVALADITGDGIDDIVTGAVTVNGHVKVFDGASGAEIASFFTYKGFDGGVSIAAGDVLGSGHAQIITGAGPGGGPHVKVFEYAGGSVSEVRSFFAYDQSFTGGVSVAAGRLEAGGNHDTIVTVAGPGGGPHVKAFDVAGPGIVETRSFMAPDLGESGGASVAAGDGLIVLGAGAGDGSRVVVLRYADEGTVLKFDAYTGFDGGVRVALGNLAGTPTIETGSGPGARTHVKVFRRIDLALLGSTYIGEPDDFGGAYVG